MADLSVNIGELQMKNPMESNRYFAKIVYEMV